MGFKRPERVPRRNGSTPTGGGGSSEPDAIEFGIAVLDEQIGKADVSFPATAEEVRHALGDREIPYDGKGGRSRSARRSIRCHRAGSKTRRSSSTHCTQCSTASGGRAVGSNEPAGRAPF